MKDIQIFRFALIIRRYHGFSWLQCFRLAVFVSNQFSSNLDYIRSCYLSGRRSELLGLGLDMVNRTK